ncbi:MAG: hypothetical protein J2P37_32815, partial [Ktedonobacteraceae bacterium]|nr:hypothetical protein [Ktedonobacteraceae bacterium]
KAVLPPGERQWRISQYEQRGCSDWERLQMVISTHPWDILTIGAGKGYRSCQHLIDGEQREHLPANLLDQAMLVAYVTDPTQNRWEIKRMYARIIVRLLRSERGWGILLDRGYGDRGYELALRTTLERHILAKGFPLWEASSSLRSQGFQIRSAFYATGPLQRFLSYNMPYLDQVGAEWSRISSPHFHLDEHRMYTICVREVATPNAKPLVIRVHQ